MKKQHQSLDMLHRKKRWYLSGNASGDYDNFDTVKSLVEFVCGVTVDLEPRHSLELGGMEGEYLPLLVYRCG